jgi:hypothetical protein|tara:strand:+ start:49 stop:855 length:807 start_codon:yes stop_codon:yes gene_type:complete
MLNNIKKISLIAALLVSSSTMASVTTNTGYIDFGNVSGSSTSSINYNGVNVTAWSDTVNVNGDGSGDNTIESAQMYKYGNGWGIVNQDESSGDYPGHSADNVGTGDWVDYDFFLFDFTENVTLTHAGFSWIYGSLSNNQVSVAALNSDDLAGKTWSQIGSTSQTIASGYSNMLHSSNNGYYTSFGQSGTNNIGNVANASSRYWLIGALNASVFGGDTDWQGNDGMKLDRIAFTRNPQSPATSVPEPTSLALFGLAIAGLFASSRKKLK